MCVRGGCRTVLPFYPHAWVSTEIACAWNGRTLPTTTVTDASDRVVCAEETATLTSVTTIGPKRLAFVDVGVSLSLTPFTLR